MKKVPRTISAEVGVVQAMRVLQERTYRRTGTQGDRGPHQHADRVSVVVDRLPETSIGVRPAGSHESWPMKQRALPEKETIAGIVVRALP
jgi:hypothetical protein